VDGGIANKMDAKLLASFEEHKDKAKDVILALNSCGGDTGDMEATIGVLERIKKTHSLATLVGRGATCGSACVFVFLAADRRYGALTSSWLFHEAWGEVVGPDGSIEQKMFSPSTDAVLEKYFIPSGVSKRWLALLRRLIRGGSDYWQTGRELWESKSGIITTPLENVVPLKDQRGRMYFMPPVVCGAFCRG
jgi:hypothetical protein